MNRNSRDKRKKIPMKLTHKAIMAFSTKWRFIEIFNKLQFGFFHEELARQV